MAIDTELLFDRPYFELEAEAFLFINDLLRRAPSFDEAIVNAEADALWDEIASGTETYEVGGPVYTLDMSSERTTFPLGPGLELHSLSDRDWVDRHFEGDIDIPAGRWAVVATITRHRAAYESALGIASSARDRADGAAIERTLLPLRVVRPAVHSSYASVPSLRFRVGLKGYRRGDRKSSISSEAWTRFVGLNPYWEPFTESETRALYEIGALFQRTTSADEFLEERVASNVREVALRAYNSAFVRQSWQDRVVDCSVVLEALFSRDDKELSFKVAVRAAALLGRDDSSAQRVYTTVRKLYDLRSQVVHAGSSAGKKAGEVIRAWDGASADPQTENQRVLRAGYVAWEVVGTALRAFLQIEIAGQHPFAKTVVDGLDAALFSSRARRTLQERAGILITDTTPQLSSGDATVEGRP